MTATVSGPGPDADPQVPIQARGWGLPILLTVVIAIALVVIGATAARLMADDPPPETVTFVVPEGTTEAVVEGAEIDIMPPEVELSVGDTLVIRNEDTETVAVGPFTVRAGETLTQTFRRPQTLIGECTLSGSGEVKIIVT